MKSKSKTGGTAWTLWRVRKSIFQVLTDAFQSLSLNGVYTLVNINNRLRSSNRLVEIALPCSFGIF